MDGGGVQPRPRVRNGISPVKGRGVGAVELYENLLGHGLGLVAVGQDA